MKIWVYLNGIQQGPYTFEEFAQLPVERSTPVWYDGLAQWLPASEAPLTAELFKTESDSVEQESVETPKTSVQPTATLNDRRSADAPAAPPTFIGWSVFVLICCFPIGGILGIIFSVASGNAYRAGDYARASRMSEYAEWSIILSIVIGLMFTPIAMLLL